MAKGQRVARELFQCATIYKRECGSCLLGGERIQTRSFAPGHHQRENLFWGPYIDLLADLLTVATTLPLKREPPPQRVPVQTHGDLFHINFRVIAYAVLRPFMIVDPRGSSLR